MGKHGPCCHCGVTSTPLWRNGPAEKPVLCNACGSRWRTKGSLTNYTPLHAREPIDLDEPKVSKVKSISIKPKEQKSHKKKLSNSMLKNERGIPYCDQNYRKVVEGDTSNRSSSGSAISYSESCAHVGNTDASDLTGSAQSNVWDPLVPSKKRTCVTRPKPSPVEKLTKDLYSILHEQQSSYLSGSSEEDLLYESGPPMDSFEIGYGGLLIRNPNSKSVEEESEASSLAVDNKSYIINEAYSGSASFPVHTEIKETNFSNSGAEKLKKSSAQVTQEEKDYNENFQILRERDSPLSSIDLKDVVTFEGFMKYLTHDEQQRLMKYLPPTDTAKPPESIKSMFNSPQFVEILAYFQQLLLEGIFDLSFSEANAEECRTLKKLVLSNFTKCRWVEYYKQLKDGDYKKSKEQNRLAIGPDFPGHANLAFLKRPHVGNIQNSSELKGGMRSPKRVCKSGAMNPPLHASPQQDSSDALSKLTDETDDFIDNEGACFSPRSFFAPPPDRRSLLVPLQFTNDSSDQDLLLDVPCNASFPEAELLYHPWRQKTVLSTSPAESEVAAEDSRPEYVSSHISNKQAKHR